MTADRFEVTAPTVTVATAQELAGGYVVEGSLVSVQIDVPTEDVVVVQGPQGPQGPAGPSYTGVAWFYGSGEPVGIIGAKPGDKYLDLNDGTIYTLGDN